MQSKIGWEVGEKGKKEKKRKAKKERKNKKKREYKRRKRMSAVELGMLRMRANFDFVLHKPLHLFSLYKIGHTARGVYAPTEKASASATN